MNKRLLVLVALAGAVAAALLLRARQRLRHLLRVGGDRLARATTRLTGKWQGVSYRLKGRHPDPDVPDLVLADRIRSSIGPLEKHLDIPRIRVMVEEHIAMIHGEVASSDQIATLEHAIAKVPGVVGVESHLHVGLTPGDTRPSIEHPRSSAARAQLIAAVRSAGISEERAEIALKAVLGTIAERLPTGPRDNLAVHLPADVRPMLERPRRIGVRPRLVRSTPELISSVLAADDINKEAAEEVITAVFAELKRLVPEEVSKVSAVLPQDLRSWWERAA